jgi:hypothetical protein
VKKHGSNIEEEDGCLLGCCAIITLMMEAASTSEMSVNFYQTTWRNNLEDSHLYTCRHENLKFHNTEKILIRMKRNLTMLMCESLH